MLLLFALLGIAGAAIAVSVSKQVPAAVSAAMQAMMKKYTSVAPTGERIFNSDTALGIVRTLASQLYTYPSSQDPTQITIHPDPMGAPPAADLSALGWARTQNQVLTIMAPVYMAESSSAMRFLRAVRPGQESFDGGQLYAVLAYPGVLAKNVNPPGVKPAPGEVATLPPGQEAIKTTMQAAHEEVLKASPELLAQYQTLVTSGTDGAIMLAVAAQLDAVGMSSAANILRKRAEGIKAVTGPDAAATAAAAQAQIQAAVTRATATPGTPVSIAAQAAQQAAQQVAAALPVTAPSAPPISTPASVVTPAQLSVLTDLQKTALVVVKLLSAHGYSMGDMPFYKAFQKSAGLTPDGYPGSSAISALSNVLASIKSPPVSLPPGLKVYPWRSSGSYDGVNAPTQDEWHGLSSPPDASPPTVAPATVSVPAGSPSVTTYSAPAGATTRQRAAVAMNNVLLVRGYKKSDQPVYKVYQSASGSAAPDGFPGSGTMGKLQADLKPLGIALAPVAIYPWKSSGAYDGVNAPSMAEWAGTSTNSQAAA